MRESFIGGYRNYLQNEPYFLGEEIRLYRAWEIPGYGCFRAPGHVFSPLVSRE